MSRTGRTAPPQHGSVRITAAHTSHSERLRGRQTRYLVSMGIRTLCFVLAVVTDGTLRWVFIVAAVVLPYVAVVMANAAGEVDRGAPEPFVNDRRRMLEAGPSARPGGNHPGHADRGDAEPRDAGPRDAGARDAGPRPADPGK